MRHSSQPTSATLGEARLTSKEGVLVLCTRVVCYLDAASPLVRVLVQIDIRALVKPVMAGLRIRRFVKVVDITEAAQPKSVS